MKKSIFYCLLLAAMTCNACFDEGGDYTPITGEACDTSTFEDYCSGNYRVSCNDGKIEAQDCVSISHSHFCRVFDPSELSSAGFSAGSHYKAECSTACSEYQKEVVIDSCAKNDNKVQVNTCLKSRDGALGNVIRYYDAFCKTNVSYQCENNKVASKKCVGCNVEKDHSIVCKGTGLVTEDNRVEEPKAGDLCDDSFQWGCYNNKAFFCKYNYSADGRSEQGIITENDCESNGTYCVWNYNDTGSISCASECSRSQLASYFTCNSNVTTYKGSQIKLISMSSCVSDVIPGKDVYITTDTSWNACSGASKLIQCNDKDELVETSCENSTCTAVSQSSGRYVYVCE